MCVSVGVDFLFLKTGYRLSPSWRKEAISTTFITQYFQELHLREQSTCFNSYDPL